MALDGVAAVVEGLDTDLVVVCADAVLRLTQGDVDELLVLCR
jgi:hypothetical protein